MRGHYKNLVVAATGTGKTVISAFDYKRFCKERPGQSNRLVVQPIARRFWSKAWLAFRGVLRDENFGWKLLVGGYRPKRSRTCSCR